MGDTGPCGPCSELHYDRIGGGRDAAHLVNQDDPNVLEIWNLVFIQFNREASGELVRLPACHVDTGMGFERLVSVLQDRPSNYDTDVFSPIFGALQKATGAPAYAGRLGAEDEGMRDTAYRVIADHIRTLSFAIADGALPSNEGRGYVLRRILRRAVRYGRQKLDAPDGFFAGLAQAVADAYGDEFPELRTRLAHVQAVLAEEESSFGSMLARGIKEFDKRMDALAQSGGSQIDGATAFFLYDSMGFPLDLTTLMAKEKGLQVDAAGFEAEMAAQRERSAAAAKAAKAGEGGRSLALEVAQTAALGAAGIKPTDDSAKYGAADAGALRGCTIAAIFDGSRFLSAADKADSSSGTIAILLDRTNFYAEAGGQVGDAGVLESDGGDAWRFDVADTQAYAGYVLHVGRLSHGSVSLGAQAQAQVDAARRRKIAPNHSMTHVLNFALRKQLGDGVDQRGSLCDADRLRFDFSHGVPLSEADLRAVEDTVRARIAAKDAVYSSLVPLEAARSVSAVRAVFGEQYPDPVRVVSVGVPVAELLADPSNGAWLDSSVEFCGGTHIASTAEAEHFCIVEETGIAKGVRRITALTRDAAAAAIAEGRALERQLAELRGAAGKEGTAPSKESVVALRNQLDSSNAPTAVKVAVRAECAALEKAAVAQAKAASSAKANAVAADAVALAERAAASGAGFAVLPLGADVDAKAVASILKTVGKAVPQLPLLALAVADSSLVCVTQVRAPPPPAGGVLCAPLLCRRAAPAARCRARPPARRARPESLRARSTALPHLCPCQHAATHARARRAFLALDARPDDAARCCTAPGAPVCRRRQGPECKRVDARGRAGRRRARRRQSDVGAGTGGRQCAPDRRGRQPCRPVC